MVLTGILEGVGKAHEISAAGVFLRRFHIDGKTTLGCSTMNTTGYRISHGAADSARAGRPERIIMDQYENPITEAEETIQDGGQGEVEDLHEPGAEATDEEAEPTDGQEPAEDPGDGGREPQKQTHADNAAARAARLRAQRETEERVNREVDAEIAAMGLIDPYTNQPIRTRQQLNAYSRAAQEAQIRERAEQENRPAEEIRREMEDRRLAEQKRKEMDDEKSRTDAERKQKEFLQEDAADFMERYPSVDIIKLQGNADFREFCGSRFGKEPLGDLYESYMKLFGKASAKGKAESKAARGVGGGTGTAGSGLTAAQQKELDAWNRENPDMKMTAKEFLSR